MYIFHLHWNSGIDFTMSTVISLGLRNCRGETVSLCLMNFFYSKELAKCITTCIAIYEYLSTISFPYLLVDFLVPTDSSKYT